MLLRSSATWTSHEKDEKAIRVRPDARAAKDGLLRIVDESGEDYLYDASQFLLVDFSQPIRRRIMALQRAS
jgi:hypothetical protein